MPKGKGYNSEAQRKFFHTKTAKKSGITQADVDKRDKESKGKSLPDYASESEKENPKRSRKVVHHSPTMLEVDMSKMRTEEVMSPLDSDADSNQWEHNEAPNHPSEKE
jgi:hypothetical protein